jgi:transposase
MPFAALDLHKREIEACVMDDQGKITHRQRFPTTSDALVAFAKRHLSRKHKVAMEATFNTWAVADVLQPHVESLTISNPLLTRAIAQAKIKTDKIDSAVLAHLLRLDYLPAVWQPDPHTRRLRSETTERATLTQDRTRLKNRMHGLLQQRLIQAPERLFDSPGAIGWLKELALDQVGRRALDRMLTQLELIEKQIAQTQKPLAELAYADPQVRLLMTLPGVGCATALALKAALGNLSRFPSADRVAAYLGLVPSTSQSGDKSYHGRITKRGNSHARWMLTEAAQSVARHPGPLGHFFRKIARKKCRNVAVVATARKLATIAWHMLKNNEPYRYALPDATRTKLLSLRVLATGQRKKGGVAKGQKSVAKLAPGSGSRQVKSLPELYREEDLPALTQAPKPAERRMLDEHAAAGFAASLLVSRRVPRKTARDRESNS